MLKGIKKCLKNPLYILPCLGRRGFFNWIPDSLYLKMIFRAEMGYFLNLNNPQTFNEKLQWLKLHDRKSFYTQLVDKYEVRKFVAEKIGEEYLIPLLGVWNLPNEIDFNILPNQFVLKCTHDSGSIIICKNKNMFDINFAKKKLAKYLKTDFGQLWREYPYKNVPRKIIAEKYIEDDSGQLKDYKIFCFNGEPKYIQVDFDRFVEHKRNIYDENWNFLDFEILYPNDKTRQIPKPQKFSEMLELAKKLSANIPHVRMDFYCIEHKNASHLLFGEFTLYHGAGFEKFTPKEYDAKFGSYIVNF